MFHNSKAIHRIEELTGRVIRLEAQLELLTGAALVKTPTAGESIGVRRNELRPQKE